MYKWITLVSRNINCSTITEEEFVKRMFSDILEAEEKYNDLYIPEWESRKVKNFEDKIAWVKKKATAFAKKKWKTEKKRIDYIESEINKAHKEYKFDTFYYGLSFFDFNVEPGQMGISGNCIISIKELTFDKLKKCFAEIKDNRYFKKATGWELTYETLDNSYQVCFRPQIKLIVDEETVAQMKKDEDDLTVSVNQFYKGCTHWGD